MPASRAAAAAPALADDVAPLDGGGEGAAFDSVAGAGGRFTGAATTRGAAAGFDCAVSATVGGRAPDAWASADSFLAPCCIAGLR